MMNRLEPLAKVDQGSSRPYDRGLDLAGRDGVTTKGHRHLWVFGLTVLFLFVLVSGFNLYIFKVIAAPTNQRILQNNVGWERSYKPILFDELKPKVAVFGASWARDAFDYEEMSKFFGREFFNFAASGAQPYENLRFLQSALAADTLDTVILNLDSFSAYQRRPPTQYGFNEDILSVKADGSPNPLKAWHRLFAKTLSGAAIASNISSLKLMGEAQKGRPKEELLRAYDRADYKALGPAIVDFKKQREQAAFPAVPLREVSITALAEQKSYLGFLRSALAAACQKGVATVGYLTPHHGLALHQEPKNDMLLARKLAILVVMQEAKKECKGKLSFYDFYTPNRVTLEGIQSSMDKGHFYRSDLHPRPTIGLAMAQVMFSSSSVAGEEFGVDLLALPDLVAEAWIRKRFAGWFK
jgi:hypothetical protein